MYSIVQRALNRLRTIDLDSRANWPKHIKVLDHDAFGPLVISIADATAFPDGSLKSRGFWITSERFGLSIPLQRPSGLNVIDSECAVVAHLQPDRRALIESVGPRLSTLGRTRPGIPVLVPVTRLTQTVAQCSLIPAGVFFKFGAAFMMPEALFARLPVADDRDGQHRRLAELFQPKGRTHSERVYLENDAVPDMAITHPSIVDLRLSYEQSGSTLVAMNRSFPGDFAPLASVVAEASELVLETKDLRLFARFASPTTPVIVADPTRARRRNPARITATSRFDMDEALRDGSNLPRGVEVLSRPDYDVPDAKIDNHRVFVDGAWRPQSEDVLAERSPGPWIVSVRNAIVASNGSVMLEDGTQLGGMYFGEVTNAPAIDGWVVEETARPSGLGLSPRRAFGHRLLQVAPRLDALMQHDRTMDVLVADSEWDDNPLLKRVGVDPDHVRRVSQTNFHHLVRVPELIISTQLHPEQGTARSDPIWQSEFVKRFVGLSATAQRRVYFARQDTSGDRGGCVNRSVLTELADEFEFEKVHPELLSFDKQVELAASTIALFGERGSAMMWSLFMPTSSRTIVVNGKTGRQKDRHVTIQNPVLAARGSRYCEINAVRVGSHQHFEVDPRLLRTAMEQLP